MVKSVHMYIRISEICLMGKSAGSRLKLTEKIYIAVMIQIEPIVAAVFIFPHIPAAITTWSLFPAAISLKPDTINSLAIMIITVKE